LQIEDYEPKKSLVISPTKLRQFYEEISIQEDTYPWIGTLDVQALSSNCRTDKSRNIPSTKRINIENLSRAQMPAPLHPKYSQRRTGYPCLDTSRFQEMDDADDTSTPKGRIRQAIYRRSRYAY
jgi:hypothetical protein